TEERETKFKRNLRYDCSQCKIPQCQKPIVTQKAEISRSGVVSIARRTQTVFGCKFVNFSRNWHNVPSVGGQFLCCWNGQGEAALAVSLFAAASGHLYESGQRTVLFRVRSSG